MRELNIEEIQMVVGGDCVYAGLTYSTGSQISSPQGGYLQCNADSTWSYWS